jgi:pyruvate/2-oxoglutarate dehydrogenase complex dihydrolipoamide dehydrogenase (E3) component
MGAHASDLIQEVVAWMNQNGTIQQLRECVLIHPTLSEVLQDLT